MIVSDYKGKIMFVSAARPGAMQDRGHYKDCALYLRPHDFFSVVKVSFGTGTSFQQLLGDAIYVGDGCVSSPTARHHLPLLLFVLARSEC
jgi:hypothetical protein